MNRTCNKCILQSTKILGRFNCVIVLKSASMYKKLLNKVRFVHMSKSERKFGGGGGGGGATLCASRNKNTP